tara:strand:- start:408 stop:620 length:213 start_codon:yes stop_codon:yes gene_type:complete
MSIYKPSNSVVLLSLEFKILALENAQVRLNTYGDIVLTNNSKKIAELNARIDAINWTEAEVNFNESQYDV